MTHIPPAQHTATVCAIVYALYGQPRLACQRGCPTTGGAPYVMCVCAGPFMAAARRTLNAARARLWGSAAP